jgi:hypothetical protein
MKNFIDWAVKAVQESKSQQHAPREFEAKPSVSMPLEILETVLGVPPEHDRDADPHGTHPQIEDAPPAPILEVVVAPKLDTPWKFPEPTSLTSTDVEDDPKFSLRKAIVAPDIYTSPEDRNRAIDLRWVLRDIKSNRLKLFPVNESDLRDLIEMGLVEMRDDAPVLTSAGNSVVS